jgi:photosystem II stability/assembly factor-like uncharacterized protein
MNRFIVILLILLASSIAHAQKWMPLGLSGGGGMFAPAISPANPDEMMVNCDMSAAYFSLDGGMSWRMIPWSQLHSNIRCRPGFHPTNPDIVYAADGWNGVKVSHDRGLTWSPCGKLPDEPHGEIVINPGDPKEILVGAGSNVFLSRDAGASWTKCDGPEGNPLSFHFDRAKAGVCYAATDKGIWRSDDDGKTWAIKSMGLPVGVLYSFACASNPRDGTILYCTTQGIAGADGSYEGGIYKSTDRGDIWQSAMGAGLNKETKPFDEWAMDSVAQYRQIASADASPNTVWAFNTNTGVPPPHNASAYRSDDGGKTWRASFQADPRFPACNVERDYVVTVDGQYYQEVPEPAVDQNNPNRALLICDGDCYMTADGGKTWQTGHTHQAPSGPDGLPRWSCTGLVVTTTWNYYFDPFDASRQFICYTDIGLAFTTNNGKTWAWWPENGRPPWRNTCYEMAFDPTVKGKIWGAFSNVHDIPNDNIISGRHRSDLPGGVCVSEDRGVHWKASNNGLPLKATTSVVLDPRSPVNSRTLYCGQFGGGVWKSVDGGKSWVSKNNGLGSDANRRVDRVFLHKDGTLFAMVTARREGRRFMDDGVGLYRSVNGGDSWKMVNASMKLLWPKDFTVDPLNSRIIYISACDVNGEEQAGLYRTIDGGATWKRLARKGPEHFGAYLSPTHQGWIYMTLTEGAPNAGLWLSKDNGARWTPMNGLPFSNAQRVAFDPANPAVIYVTTFGGSVWRGPAQ